MLLICDFIAMSSKGRAKKSASFSRKDHDNLLIDLSYYEDTPQGDITSQAIFKNAPVAKAIFWAKEPLVVSGWRFVNLLLARHFKKLTLSIDYQDGSVLTKRTKIGTVSGPITDILRAERLMLNALQHLSGIATQTQIFIKKISNQKVSLLDTRKTLPAWRFFEKEAVRHGGGQNHRFSLSDHYMIKDNHSDGAGSLEKAILLVKEDKVCNKRKSSLIITEVRTDKEFKTALKSSVDIILLDNMSKSEIKKCVRIYKQEKMPHKPLLEISGGVTLATISQSAKLGIHRISVGALTHSARAVDISLKIEKTLSKEKVAKI